MHDYLKSVHWMCVHGVLFGEMKNHLLSIYYHYIQFHFQIQLWSTIYLNTLHMLTDEHKTIISHANCTTSMIICIQIQQLQMQKICVNIHHVLYSNEAESTFFIALLWNAAGMLVNFFKCLWWMHQTGKFCSDYANKIDSPAVFWRQFRLVFLCFRLCVLLLR